MGDDGPGPGTRRRTDPADALWRGVPAPRESLPPAADRRVPARPVLAPEARAVGMRPGSTSRTSRAPDDVRGAGRPRLPMPPVPPALPPRAPRTSAAPFDAVPTPEREHPAGALATALEDRPPAPSRSAAVPSLPPRPVSAAATPVVPRSPSMPARTDDEHDAPWMTGRGAVRAPRVPGRSESAPAVERRASRLPAGGVRPSTGPGESPAYGDWTKPSGSGRVAIAPPAAVPAAAPLTTAIPDREVAGRRPADDDLDDYYDDDRDDDRDDAYLRRPAVGYDDEAYDAGYGDRGDDRVDDRGDDIDDGGLARRRELDRRGPESSPGTGLVVGGRAASRAERLAREEARVAAEAARRKEARRTGSVSLDEDERPRRPRRLLTGLVAVGTVAAAILGVYTITTPEAEVAADRSPSSSAAASAPTAVPEVTAALPPLDTAPAPVEAAPAAPVRVPVTVLNATEINGLAADISGVIAGNGQGWTTGAPGGYPNGDVAATTVFYTEGDAQQEQAAVQLKEQFPELSGPAPRFFEVPAEVQATGLVVVAAGDWQP